MLFTLLATLLAQVTYPPCPPDGQCIADTARLLSDDDAASVRTACEKLQRDHGIPLVVVTIPSMASCGIRTTTIERFATQVFDHYGGTRSNWTRGILVLVSKEDRKARIECGHDWGSSLNGQSASVMNGTMVPQFRRGEYGKGISSGVAALANAAPGIRSRPASTVPATTTRWTPPSQRVDVDPVLHSYNSGWGFGSFGCIFALAVVIIVFSILMMVVRMVMGVVSPWSGGMWRSPSYFGGYSPGGLFGGGYRRSNWGSGWGGSSRPSSGFSGGGSRGGFSGGGGATGSW